jgi:hypothetical protein
VLGWNDLRSFAGSVQQNETSKKKSHASAIQPGKQQKHALQFSFDDIGCRKFQTMVLTLW